MSNNNTPDSKKNTPQRVMVHDGLGMEGLDTSVAKMALFKIKEMQDNIKAMEKQNATKNKPTTGKG